MQVEVANVNLRAQTDLRAERLQAARLAGLTWRQISGFPDGDIPIQHLEAASLSREERAKRRHGRSVKTATE